MFLHVQESYDKSTLCLLTSIHVIFLFTVRIEPFVKKMPTIAIISTSHAYMGDHPTGLWLHELASPYYVFKQAKIDVVLVSVKGGPVPIDATSMGPNFFTDAAKKFLHDAEAFGQLCHSKSVDELNAMQSKVDGP